MEVIRCQGSGGLGAQGTWLWGQVTRTMGPGHSHLIKAATADMTAVLRALSVVASLTNTMGSVKSFLTASMTEEVSLACCSCDRVTRMTSRVCCRQPK